MMTTSKLLGTLLGVQVIAILPDNPKDSPYTVCRFKGKPLTTELVSFSRDLWEDETTLTYCFNGSIGDGISVALHKQLIHKE